MIERGRRLVGLLLRELLGGEPAPRPGGQPAAMKVFTTSGRGIGHAKKSPGAAETAPGVTAGGCDSYGNT